MGKYSTSGWWYYFPVAFLLKTPIPILILLICRITLLFLPSQKIRFSKDEWFIVLPMALFFLSALNVKLNIGLRHILQFYPLFYIWLSSIYRQPDTNVSTNKEKNVFTKTNFGVIELGFTILFLIWYIFQRVYWQARKCV